MTDSIHQGNQQSWLRQYYFSRTIFSILWAVSTFIAARHSYFWVSFLLILYPAWDAIANYIDAIRNGGFGRNRMQTVNIIRPTTVGRSGSALEKLSCAMEHNIKWRPVYVSRCFFSFSVPNNRTTVCRQHCWLCGLWGFLFLYFNRVANRSTKKRSTTARLNALLV
ncbi:hypothetical protein ACXDGL_000783 [Klebsiella quasipneumoniae]